MKKLTLNIDDLRVHSFRTAEATGERGTVGAYSATGTQATCGSCQTTVHYDECYQYSVYVACQDEPSPW
jgi:hypothetical protein